MALKRKLPKHFIIITITIMTIIAVLRTIFDHHHNNKEVNEIGNNKTITIMIMTMMIMNVIKIIIINNYHMAGATLSISSNRLPFQQPFSYAVTSCSNHRNRRLIDLRSPRCRRPPSPSGSSSSSSSPWVLLLPRDLGQGPLRLRPPPAAEERRRPRFSESSDIRLRRPISRSRRAARD